MHVESVELRRTRQEFEAWCNVAAAQHGYAVSFEGLGHAKEESRALEAFMEDDLGASTQVFNLSVLTVRDQPFPFVQTMC